jgi:hypothetical protein
LGAVLAGVSSLAHAQTPVRPVAQAPTERSLRDLLDLRASSRQGPPVARYAADGVTFVFDRPGSVVRFDSTGEVVVLQLQRAPKGDVLYFDDLGQPVLRVSGLGGMTLFTPQQPKGVPVAIVAPADPIHLEVMRALELRNYMLDVSTRMSRLVRRQVGIVAPDIGPESANLLSDVINLTWLAYQRNAMSDRALEATRRIGVVEVVEGSSADVKVQGDTLRITIAAKKGFFGRPSSARIARALAH